MTKGVEPDPLFSGIPNSRDDRSWLRAPEEEGAGLKNEVVHANSFSSDLIGGMGSWASYMWPGNSGSAGDASGWVSKRASY